MGPTVSETGVNKSCIHRFAAQPPPQTSSGKAVKSDGFTCLCEDFIDYIQYNYSVMGGKNDNHTLIIR